MCARAGRFAAPRARAVNRVKEAPRRGKLTGRPGQ